jgi:hypothetical protein
MSHEVVFLPHILGQTWADAVAAARTAAREDDPRIIEARLEPWPRLVLHAAELLGQIEEYRGRGQRELVHPVTRLRFTFFGQDAVIALPYWYDGPVARMAATMTLRFAHAVEEETGLSAYDPQIMAPLASLSLEQFVAGYLRGRAAQVAQDAGRGRIPLARALPPARSSQRRELPPAPGRQKPRELGTAEQRARELGAAERRPREIGTAEQRARSSGKDLPKGKRD